LNAIRKQHPALQLYSNLTFHVSENPTILFYRKAPTEPTIQWTSARGHVVPAPVARSLGAYAPAAAGNILVAVNTDPHHAHDTMVHVPIHEMGIDDEQPYIVHDLLTGTRYTWRGVRNYVRLDPGEQVGHVLVVERKLGK
jgi:starch synthase (maltosyl-transferring)